jgi:membrane-bound lytic murein transglycosylase A
LVWLKDPVKAFFLHVQGSGAIHLPDGRLLRVGYAGKNGRPYRSIGQYLIEKGEIAPEAMSLQAIEAYLEEHPERIEEVLWHNESYIFFRKIDKGPVGSISVVLTAGRSIATDPAFYPRGGLAFLKTQQPVLDDSGEVTGWKPLNRWVLNQDTGGAIKGYGRVDLFAGSGKEAEWVAGRLKHSGMLYFLVKKEFGKME